MTNLRVATIRSHAATIVFEPLPQARRAHAVTRRWLPCSRPDTRARGRDSPAVTRLLLPQGEGGGEGAAVSDGEDYLLYYLPNRAGTVRDNPNPNPNANPRPDPKPQPQR